jgi:uncharacterized membrane protein
MEQKEEFRHSDAGTKTSKTKSRTEELKEKEYKEILSMNKAYLRDFMEVLEEAEWHITNPDQHSDGLLRSTDLKLPFRIKKTLSTSIIIETTTEELVEMAQKTMKHSAEVIERFRRLVCG